MLAVTENIMSPCVCTMRAILSFSNVLVWTVENASKRQCGCESFDAFPMTTKMHTFEKGLVWRSLDKAYS